MSGREDRTFRVGSDGIYVASAFGSDFQFVTDRGTDQFPGRIMLFRIVAEIVRVVQDRNLLFLVKIVDILSRYPAEIRIASGEQGGKGTGFVDVGKFEPDVVIHQSFVHQPLETAFAECVVKIFYVIAPQLVDGDAHDQFGRALLSLQIGCCQNCDERCQYFSYPMFHIFL